MASVVGQGVIRLLGRCRGGKFPDRGDKPQIDATALEHQGPEPKTLFCFLRKLDDSPRAFETVVSFLSPKDSFIHHFWF